MHENSPPPRRRTPAAGRRLAALAAGLACAAGLAAGSPALAASRPGPLAVPVPPGNTYLYAVSADSASDAWAVGTAYTAPAGRGYYQSLTLHWNGTSWAKVNSPDPGGTTPGSLNGTYLTGVAAVSPTDAWAVGYYYKPPTLSSNGAMLLHWNGTKWANVAPANLGNAGLESVSAVSATDIWAVGGYTTSSGQHQLLMLHYNGTKWSQVAAPASASGSGAAPSYLNQVKAISATDAWAAGAYPAGGGSQTLMLHWNGTKWSRVATPNPGGASENNVVTGVGASSATNVWGVGYYNTKTTDGEPFSMHLNGSAWSQVTVPNPSPLHEVSLTGVGTLSPTSAWAVGSYTAVAASGQATLSLALRWNGTKWTQVKTPSPGGGGADEGVTSLNAVSDRTSGDAWAVGYDGNPTRPFETLILHWNGTSWTQVQSPN
jgi:hypothetical protein